MKIGNYHPKKDIDLFYRIAEFYCFSYVDIPLMEYYIHEMGISRQQDKRLTAFNFFSKKASKAKNWK